MTRLLFLILLGITFSLLWTQSFASAEIKITPPNWQPSPTNNSTAMAWFHNSTKSLFAIAKVPDNLSFPMFFVGPLMAQFLADKGVLESADQITFGHSNFGYRYFLNISLPSKFLNSSDTLNNNHFLPNIPKEVDVPFRGMLILTQKYHDLYAIIFLNPKENFDSVLNEIKPAIDSIQFTNSTKVTIR